MHPSHSRPFTSTSFDDPNLVSAAGLTPIIKLAEKAGLRKLADKWLSVPTDKGANAELKVTPRQATGGAGLIVFSPMRRVLRKGGMMSWSDPQLGRGHPSRKSGCRPSESIRRQGTSGALEHCQYAAIYFGPREASQRPLDNRIAYRSEPAGMAHGRTATQWRFPTRFRRSGVGTARSREI